MIRSILGAAFLLSGTGTAATAQDVPEPQIETVQLNDKVHILYGGGGMGASVGVLETDKELVLVDVMHAKTRPKLLRALSAISQKPVRHIFNTHHHADHAGGNEGFLADGATVVRQVAGSSGELSNELAFQKELTLTLSGERVTAYAIQSHTPNDALIFFPTHNVIFLGDTFTTNWHPTFFFGGVKGQMKIIEKTLALADDQTVIVPGHGKVTDRRGVIRFRDTLTAFMARMQALDAEGRGADGIKADGQLLQIMKGFLQDGSRESIPTPRYERFIDRLISLEFMPVDEKVLPKLAAYAGSYRYEDGMPLEIVAHAGRLSVYEDGRLSGDIIPLSARRFHFVGRLEGQGHLTFEMNNDGKIVGATYVGEQQRFTATRVDD